MTIFASFIFSPFSRLSPHHRRGAQWRGSGSGGRNRRDHVPCPGILSFYHMLLRSHVSFFMSHITYHMPCAGILFCHMPRYLYNVHMYTCHAQVFCHMLRFTCCADHMSAQTSPCLHRRNILHQSNENPCRPTLRPAIDGCRDEVGWIGNI